MADDTQKDDLKSSGEKTEATSKEKARQPYETPKIAKAKTFEPVSLGSGAGGPGGMGP